MDGKWERYLGVVEINVFITDASYKHTLGAVRALGKNGIRVIAGSSSEHSLSFYSKHCSKEVIYPSPRGEMAFIKFMLDFVMNNKIDVLLPIGYLTTTLFSKYKDEFCRYTRLPIANYESMKIACNKDKTMSFAKKKGITVPKMYNTVEEIDKFPIVVKGIKESGHVNYVNSLKELTNMNLTEYIMQEYIPGEGYGFYALFDKGSIKAYFMHKRLREYPITGGPSVAAESIYDSKLKELGLKLLSALNWHGVAMVEFKKDLRDGKFKLMEVNPKFWGSLDLAIASGVDFPNLIVKMAANEDFKPIFEYKTGIKFRWLFPGDFLHFLAKPSSYKNFICDFFDENTKNNIWFGDIKPNLIQFYETIPNVISVIKKGNLKYPHGKPEVI